MCLNPDGSYGGMSKTLASVERLMNESETSPTKLHYCPSVLYPDRIRAKQHYGCFPEYSYNTAFGSLLSGRLGMGVMGIDELHANVSPISFRSTSLPLPSWSDRETSAFNMSNNSAWIESCPPVFKPNCDGDAPSTDHVRLLTVDLIQHLIGFLNEFLAFLPTIIDDQVHYCETQRTDMIKLIEHLQQLRTDVLREITSSGEYPTSVILFDISTVSFVLQQLSSLLRQFNRQEQYLTFNALSMHRSKLIQWSNDLEALTASSTRIMKMRSNEISSLTIPALDSCSINHSFPVTDDLPDLCIPWPVLDPARNLCAVSCPLESTCGIEEEVHPRKTRMSKRKDPKYMFNDPVLMQSTSHTSPQGRFRIGSPPSTSGLVRDDGRSPLSTRSILSKTIQDRTGPGSAVHSKSTDRSKQSSPLLHTTSSNDQSDSTHPAVPLTMDAVQQSQVDLSRDKDRQRDASSTWSYQTYAYGSPSPMISGVVDGSEQNLPSGQDPSFVRQPSTLDSYSAVNLPPGENKSIRSFTSGKTADTLTAKSAPNERFEPNERRGLNHRKHQSTGSPSIQSINDVSSRQNVLSSNLSSPFPMNDAESDLNFDGYSNNPRSPSVNLPLKQSIGPLNQLNVIEGPRSAEGTSSLETPSLPKRNPKPMNTDFDLANKTDRHQQRSASATSTSEQSFSDEHQKRRVASAHFDRLKKRRRDDVTTTIRVSPPPPISLTRQSYFDKMMTCVRRTLVNRVNRSQYRTQ